MRLHMQTGLRPGLLHVDVCKGVYITGKKVLVVESAAMQQELADLARRQPVQWSAVVEGLGVIYNWVGNSRTVYQNNLWERTAAR